MNSVQRSKATRALAALLTIGGLLGATLTSAMGVRLMNHSDSLADPIAAFLLFGLFACAIVAGVLLWRSRAAGNKWAIAIFSAQIPAITTSNFVYSWFTGITAGPALKISDHGFAFSLGFNAGFGGNLAIGEGDDLSIGINLFAVLALAFLVRTARSYGPLNHPG